MLEYCYSLIEKTNRTHQFILDIAALFQENDLYNLPKKIAAEITLPQDVAIDRDQYYGKIWAYLSAAAEICSEKITK